MPFPHLIISNPNAWKGCPSPSNPGFLICFPDSLNSLGRVKTKM
nr:MAG TPA: hypothetical protein [Caudoviricetes sp.]